MLPSKSNAMSVRILCFLSSVSPPRKGLHQTLLRLPARSSVVVANLGPFSEEFQHSVGHQRFITRIDQIPLVGTLLLIVRNRYKPSPRALLFATGLLQRIKCSGSPPWRCRVHFPTEGSLHFAFARRHAAKSVRATRAADCVDVKHGARLESAEWHAPCITPSGSPARRVSSVGKEFQTFRIQPVPEITNHNDNDHNIHRQAYAAFHPSLQRPPARGGLREGDLRDGNRTLLRGTRSRRIVEHSP